MPTYTIFGMHFNMMRYWKMEDHFNPESCLVHIMQLLTYCARK